MRDVLGPGTVLGYCTNVHAGRTLAETKLTLETHALEVKRLASPREPLDIGLWLPAAAAREVLDDPDGTARLRDWLDARGLRVFTMNGFPYGDFHKDVVKHDVYRPDWTRPERLEYTLGLARILAGLLDEWAEGSISTLPLGWRNEVDPARCYQPLATLAMRLRQIREETGRFIHVDLEPEPGCALTYDTDTAIFFERIEKFPRVGDRPYVGVCHDVCHAAVVFEEQTHAIRSLRASPARIGKVQISSGVRAPAELFTDGSAVAIEALRDFAEPRYLHQTVIGPERARERFYDDLPAAIAARERGDAGEGEWRVHFHVPVFAESLGVLSTTSVEIAPAIRAARELHDTRAFEVETYAWGVLADELRTGSLAEGIARELLWVEELAEREGLS